MNPIDPVLRYWLNRHLRGNGLGIPRAHVDEFGRVFIRQYYVLNFDNWVNNILMGYQPHRPRSFGKDYIDYWGLMNGK